MYKYCIYGTDIGVSFIRHGYARWQYISDDRDNGLFETARRELNLPSANELISSQSNNEANVSARTYQFPN